MNRSAVEKKAREVQAEFDRLGLDPDAMPGGGLSVGGQALGSLLTRLRSMSPGVTWRDVFPDIPAHWEAGKPETWTTPYRPLGVYDYQELPAGPAVRVNWPRPGAPDQLERFLGAAKQAGWSIHGAGLLEVANPKWPTVDAMIVLERGTSDDVFADFLEWLEGQRPVTLAVVSRTGKEQYAPSRGAA
jgi:hypothetical protein